MDVTNLMLAILGIGLLVAFHELGHHLVALWCGMRVRRFSIGFGKAILRWHRNGVDYTVGVLPLGGFVDIVGMNPLEEGADEDPRSFQRRPRWARALVIAAGPAFNYALAFAVLVGVYWLGNMKQDVEIVITEVVAASAAEEAGLRKGDVIVTLGGEKISRETSIPQRVGESAGRPLPIQIRRGTETLELKPIPRGADGSARLGIGFEPRPIGPGQAYTLPEAVTLSSFAVVGGTLRILSDVGDLLRRVVAPGESALDQLRGPPEMVKQLKTAANRSVKDFLMLFAVLSLMLGLFNLFPIPPLDGSKLIFLGAETLARRAIPGRAQIYIHGVGMMFMIGLMVVVSVKDFMREEPAQEAPAKTAPAPAPPAPAPAPAAPAP
ncbi:MAG: site-2 protease family protein [Deltaproteobacteria bacterium]|nr:site-2 protease family protein [Deltaproteobacteria bacterium]